MDAARQLIEDYRSTWENVIRGDLPLSALDGFFNLPCFMVSVDGAMKLYTSKSEVTEFNQSRLDAFVGGGAQNATLRAVDVQSQGQHLSLATVNWELTRADGSLERAWRHYYTILAGAPKPTIVISAFQVGS